MTTIDPFSALNGSSAGTAQTKNEAGSADRFLKLLVAQMENQDPLNPMDNAQVTSQMAQINTVNGIETLNQTVKGLNAQFVQMQALQGASLIGRDVTVEGDELAIAGGIGIAGFELDGPADRVKVEVLDAGGRVADTLQLGALGSGLHGVEWPAGKIADGTSMTFRVVANSGTATVTSTPLMRDRVEAVSLAGDTLTLELERSGATPYPAVRAVN